MEQLFPNSTMTWSVKYGHICNEVIFTLHYASSLFHGEICVFLNHVKVTWCYRHGYNNVNGFIVHGTIVWLYGTETSNTVYEMDQFKFQGTATNTEEN